MRQVGVFHPGTQHSWQTALALQQLDRLAWYATSIFYRPDRWPYTLERLPGPLGKRLGSEFRRFFHPALDPALVRTAGAWEWFERIAARAGSTRLAAHLDAIGNRRFVTGITQSIRDDSALLLWGYNNSSRRAFELGRRLGNVCILDRTVGDLRTYNAMMAALAERYGDWFLPGQTGFPRSMIEEESVEHELADHILVGSQFAADTVREHATAEVATKLRVLEYCYDEALFADLPHPRARSAKEPVRFLFLGLAIPRKGIQYVLEAISRIPASQASLTIVGTFGVPNEIIARYADRIDHRPTVARADVPAIMAAHDVLLFPSHFEGAGIVLYEALAAGMALIQSDHAAIAVTPETGILLPTPATDEVEAAMLALIADRDRLHAMREAAQPAARAYNFAGYRARIATFLDDSGI